MNCRSGGLWTGWMDGRNNCDSSPLKDWARSAKEQVWEALPHGRGVWWRLRPPREARGFGEPPTSPREVASRPRPGSKALELPLGAGGPPPQQQGISSTNGEEHTVRSHMPITSPCNCCLVLPTCKTSVVGTATIFTVSKPQQRKRRNSWRGRRNCGFLCSDFEQGKYGSSHQSTCLACQ